MENWNSTSLVDFGVHWFRYASLNNWTVEKYSVPWKRCLTKFSLNYFWLVLCFTEVNKCSKLKNLLSLNKWISLWQCKRLSEYRSKSIASVNIMNINFKNDFGQYQKCTFKKILTPGKHGYNILKEFLILLFLLKILFIFRGERRKRGREIPVGCLLQAANSGMCPD